MEASMNRRNIFVLTVLLILTLILCVSVACAPTQNQGNPSGDNNQNSGQISSGDNQTGDSEDKPQNPSFPSGDTGSENIGGGDSDTDEIEDGDNNSDIGEEKPEVKYPSTIAEMTIEQKKILTDYLDETYKQRIIGKMSIGANLENTQTIGYEFDDTSMLGLYKTVNKNSNKFYTIKCTASNDIDGLIKALVENKNISNYISVSVVGIKSSAIFTIPLTENEYSANAATAYTTLNLMLDESKITNSDTSYSTNIRDSIPEFEIGNWPVVETIAITVDGNNCIFHTIRVVSKDYNKIGNEEVDTKILGENYLEFGSENTIWNLKIQTDDNYNYVVQNDKVYLMNYKGNSVDVVIPNAIDGKEVVSIGNVFTGDKDIKSIVLPKGVISIGKYQFSGCSSLTSIDISSSVTSIGEYAFSGCSSLQYKEYDNGFYLGNKENPYFALIEAKNKDIASCTINGNTKVIGGSAFEDCRSMTSIKIPSSVTSIGDSAFDGCNSLKYNKYNNGLYLGNKENPYLVLIKAINTDITSCEINANTKVIYSSNSSVAFIGCSSLTSIEIPSSVTGMCSYAFYNCSSLTIYCQAESKPSGWSSNWNNSNRPVVWNCKNNDIASDGNIYYVAGNGIRYALKDGKATVVEQSESISGAKVIPNQVTYKGNTYSVTSIGSSAFSDCSSLTSIEIPSNVTRIGGWAFAYCSSLTIYCEAESKPSGWSSTWNRDDRPVVWGYKG